LPYSVSLKRVYSSLFILYEKKHNFFCNYRSFASLGGVISLGVFSIFLVDRL
jgi:hypothetical protein